VKRKLEIEANTTQRVEETVKEAEANLNNKEYDHKQLVQHLEQLKGTVPRFYQSVSDWTEVRRRVVVGSHHVQGDPGAVPPPPGGVRPHRRDLRG
jgi:hypothetical protein